MGTTSAVIEVPDLSRVALASLSDDALQGALRDCAQARRRVLYDEARANRTQSETR